METKASKTSEALLFNSPELKTGETYYIEAGDQDIQVTVNSILNQYGGSSGSGFGRMPGDGSGDFEKKPGAGNTSGKASVVEIQEALPAETLLEGIHILGSRDNVEQDGVNRNLGAGRPGIPAYSCKSSRIIKEFILKPSVLTLILPPCSDTMLWAVESSRPQPGILLRAVSVR